MLRLVWVLVGLLVASPAFGQWGDSIVMTSKTPAAASSATSPTTNSTPGQLATAVNMQCENGNGTVTSVTCATPTALANDGSQIVVLTGGWFNGALPTTISATSTLGNVISSCSASNCKAVDSNNNGAYGLVMPITKAGSDSITVTFSSSVQFPDLDVTVITAPTGFKNIGIDYTGTSPSASANNLLIGGTASPPVGGAGDVIVSGVNIDSTTPSQTGLGIGQKWLDNNTNHNFNNSWSQNTLSGLVQQSYAYNTMPSVPFPSAIVVAVKLAPIGSQQLAVALNPSSFSASGCPLAASTFVDQVLVYGGNGGATSLSLAGASPDPNLSLTVTAGPYANVNAGKSATVCGKSFTTLVKSSQGSVAATAPLTTNYGATQITGITVGGQTNLAFTTSSGETNPINFGAVAATASDGGTPSVTIGTNPRCTSSANNSAASISGGSLLFTDPTPGTAGTYFVCLVATGNYPNSPFGQTIPIAGTTSGGAPAIALAGCSSQYQQPNGSCFNTEVVNLDFSGASQSFVGTKGNFDASQDPTTNWLNDVNCAAPPQTMMYATVNGAFAPIAIPCSGYQSVTDTDGKKSLRIEMNNNDFLNGVGDAMLAVTNTIDSNAPALPQAYYFKYHWRIDSTSLSNAQDLISQLNNAGAWNYPFSGGIWFPAESALVGWNGNNDVGRFEWDLESHIPPAAVEQSSTVGITPGQSSYDNYGPLLCYYGVGYDDNTITNQCNPGGSPTYAVSGYNPVGGGYVTIEGRITTDNAGNEAQCTWVNSTFLACQTFTFANPLMRGGRSILVMFGSSDWCEKAIPQGNNCPTAVGATLRGPIYIYFRDLQVWSCSNWNNYTYNTGNNTITNTSADADACAGAVLTSNP